MAYIKVNGSGGGSLTRTSLLTLDPSTASSVHEGVLSSDPANFNYIGVKFQYTSNDVTSYAEALMSAEDFIKTRELPVLSTAKALGLCFGGCDADYNWCRVLHLNNYYDDNVHVTWSEHAYRLEPAATTPGPADYTNGFVLVEVFGLK